MHDLIDSQSARFFWLCEHCDAQHSRRTTGNQAISHQLNPGHRNRKAQPFHGTIIRNNLDGGDPYHLTVVIDECAAGIAKIDGGTGLNQVHQDPIHLYGPVQGGYDPLGNGGPVPQGVTDGNHHISAAQLIGIAELCRNQSLCFHFENRDILLRISPHQSGR